MALARSLNPLRCCGTRLSPQLLLAAKLIALPLLWFNAPGSIPEPFVPFLLIFDRIGHPVIVQRALSALAYVAAVAILFNRAVRAACFTLGAVTFVSILSCRGSYYNNAVYYGFILMLIGLAGDEGEGQEDGQRPWLLRLQVALVYAGAGLDKILDPDWRSGQFFENWASVIEQSFYLRAKSWFPPMALSQLTSWATFTLELGLAALLLVPRTSRFAVRVGMVFHTALTFFIGNTFGFFYFAILASYLAFVDWPAGRLAVVYDGASPLGRTLRRLLGWIDVDERFDWAPAPPLPRASVVLRVRDRTYAGASAVRVILLYNPVTYLFFVALVGLSLTRNLEATGFSFATMLLGLAFFLPHSSAVGAAERSRRPRSG